jgi:quinol monooxygenase YgiN
MIAYRTTWKVKPGCMQKVLDLIEAESKQVKPRNFVVRVYTSTPDPDTLVWDEIWTSREGHDKFWAVYNATPGGAAFFERLTGVAEARAPTEEWNVIVYEKVA